jgi:PAS domain S-box-containing protein
MKPTTPRGGERLRRYGIALGAVLVATLARLVLAEPFADRAPFQPFYLAVVVAAAFGGLAPGLAAVIGGAVAGTWLVHRHSGAPFEPSDLGITGAYLVVAFAIAVAIARVQALRGRAQVTADLLDHAQDAIFAWSPDGGISFWNGGAERLYGFTKDEALGRSPHELLATRFPGTVDDVLAALVSRGEWRGELGHRTRGGRVVYVESRMVRLALPAGDFSVLETNRDLTERRLAAERQRERELSLSLALDGAGLHFGALDPTTGRVETDAATLALFDAPPGATIDEIAARIFPEDAPRFAEALASVAPGGPSRRVDYRVAGPGGRPRWLRTVLTATDVPTAEGERRLRVLGFVQDVTAQVEAESELRAREAQFRLLANTIPQLAWMAGPDGAVFWYNQRWYDYTGAEPGTMLGWEWQKVHDPFEVPRVVARVRAAIAAGEPWEDTFPLRRRDGQMRWHLSRALPLRDASGRITLWFGTHTDISDRREMEEQLRAADRRKDEFLATLAHELRNPLAPIGNGLQVLRRPDASAEMTVRVAAMMERQLAHMVRLIDDLLDVSRVTRGKLELKRERVQLGDVIEAALETTRPAIEQHRHALEVRLPPEAVWLDADRARLAQVFGNLLSNAAKYTPPGGRIVVDAIAGERDVAVRVRDDGVGIPREALGEVFELFSQVRAHQSHAAGGLGIGLALVRALVAMHGGRVDVASDGPGRGSTFTVTLPRAPAAAPAATATPPEPAIAARGHVRVLVADDNDDAAQSLAMLLRLEGCEVRAVADGEAAVRVAREFRPAMIFMDLGMPVVDGLEATRRLRREPWGREITIVALTGWGQPGDRQRSREAGVDRHFVKPLEPAALAELLDELAATAR